MEELKKTNRTKVKRSPKRAVYDIETIYKILDEAFVCHVAFKIDGQVFIIPTAYGRKDNEIFIHGSNKSRMLNSIRAGEDICISVTLIDGIVAARSVFHHSVNYRSVIIFSKGEEILEKDEKLNALKIITEHIIPNRWEEARKPNEKEMQITSVFKFKIDEASAKIRVGPPVDEKEDYNLNVWAGVIPLKTVTENPIRDTLLEENIPLPNSIKNYYKGRGLNLKKVISMKENKNE